ncbi:hypothetical protein C8R45DRAFT_1209256 [Mycena sanguinolenta]|nr:hypothetical protein C8R45DRAFT_1209256 [Mycena sanguinolenta]
MSHRYQPYFHRKKPTLPQPHNGDDPRMINHYNQLIELNIRQQKLCTFVHDTNCYSDYPRPQRVVGRSRKDIAASGFHRVWAPFSSPFYCPHLRRSGLAYDPLILRLDGIHQGGSADFYHAADHECEFKMVVPRVNITKTLLTFEDREQFDRQQHGHDTDDEDGEPYEPSAGHQEPTSSQGSSSSTISSFSSLGTAASLSSFTDGISSVTSGTSFSSSPSSAIAPRTDRAPRPFSNVVTRIAKPTPRSGPFVLRSFYSADVAEARKRSDVELLLYLDEISEQGLLDRDPSVHPAWNYEVALPPILHPYDMHLHGNLHNRRLQHLQFFDQPIGRVIREMSQALGVPFQDYAALVRSTQVCECCLSHFSPDGYDNHRREGKCANHPALLPIPAAKPCTNEFKLRSFRDGCRPPWTGDTIHTPVGAALLEWNSRLGIPCDVWLMIASGMVLCGECDLVRTIPAHRLHLDGKGNCTDPGQHVGMVEEHGQE